MGISNKSDKSEIVILLTSCVNPDKMDKTWLQDSEIRLGQYLDTIAFFLETTDLKIVIADNTGTDFSNYIGSSRVECLQFNGNNYCKTLGKGYGEAKILEYAFANSNFLKSANYIIKITGRTPLLNFNKLLAKATAKPETVFVEIPFKKKHHNVFSRAIFAPKRFYTDFFLKGADRINDSTGYYFESHLYIALNKWLNDGHNCISTRIPFEFQGISGTDGKPLAITPYHYLKTIVGSNILNIRMKRHKCIHKV